MYLYQLDKRILFGVSKSFSPFEQINPELPEQVNHVHKCLVFGEFGAFAPARPFHGAQALQNGSYPSMTCLFRAS